MRNFGSIRKNFNVPSPKSSPKKESPPKARRPVLNPAASPHANRLARPPRVPEIFEEDEEGLDALEEDESQTPPPITRRKKLRSASSSSHPPAPAPAVSPPPPPTFLAPIVATIQVDINESLLKPGKKRISRRQSGLINVPSSGSSGSSSSASNSSRSRATSPPRRPSSPAFGSPLRRDAGLAEEEEEYEALHGQRSSGANEEVPLERVASKGQKKRTLTQAQAEEAPAEDGHEREKRRLREDPEIAGQRMQDVINGSGARVSLPPLDTNISGMDPSVSNTALLICQQIRIATELHRILIQICPPQHLLIALPAHRSQHREPHPHHRILPRRTTRPHRQYLSLSRLPNLMH